jgi:hypothetical protein
MSKKKNMSEEKKENTSHSASARSADSERSAESKAVHEVADNVRIGRSAFKDVYRRKLVNIVAAST